MRAARLVLTLSLFALAASPAFAGDLIVLRSGKVQGNPKASNPPSASDFAGSDWTVIEENLDVIKYRLPGVKQVQRVKSETVARVYHDPSNGPSAMTRALEAENNGDFAGARTLWQSMEEDRRPWAQAMGAFRAASTYWVEGNAAGASKALAAFQSKYPKSWYMPQAIQLSARALQAQGKIAEARKAFASVKKLSGVSEATKNGADYWITWIDERLARSKNDNAGLKKAREAYKLLKGKLGGLADPDSKLLATRCQLGVASCQVAMGDWKEAKSDLERIIGQSKDGLTLAGAHTLMGNALLKQNAQKHDKAVYRDALWNFLRVGCLYGKSEGAEDYHAESLYQAGQMFRELRPTGTSDADKETKRRWERYAQNEWRQCQRRYPGSHWASESARAARSN